MDTAAPMDPVLNQPGAPPGADPWAASTALRDHAAAAGADCDVLAGYGATLAALRESACDAERHPPELVRFDRRGVRMDTVRFHPGYHALMAAGIAQGYAALAWEGAKAGHATHAAMVVLHSAVEPGTCCPMTMTYAAWPVLAAEDALAAAWQPKLASRIYDPEAVPVTAKRGATMGMAMTEKGGGSDLRGLVTRAEPGDGGWLLHGHKWFCSAPMSDGLLTLAQTGAGLTCFLVPRILPDGRLNAVHLMRLKDKLGNRANASAEIEYQGAWSERLGAEGQGVRTILEMVHHTRLDTALAPCGLMAAALHEAHHWAAHRTAFQRRLIDQPLMAQVLADLALDAEAALALGMRVARAFDGATEGEAAFARLGVALAKFHANKLAPQVIVEAMEVLGGMGYVEDTPLPMLYREAPLNGIWEGSGNVICLDILRTLAKVRAAREALAAELDLGRGSSADFDAALRDWHDRWTRPGEAEARAFAEATACLLAASVLARTAPAPVSDAYAGTRLGGRRALYGTAGRLDAAPILARLAPG
jgi:putative acyl-CoA dehydrogenase